MNTNNQETVLDAMLTYEIEIKRWRKLMKHAHFVPKQGHNEQFDDAMSELAYARGVSDALMYYENR
jgi:hypothetical protein